MQLIIHRGTNQIGGSCIELKDENTRLLFDIGLPLDDVEEANSSALKPDIKGLWANEKTNIDAIFITHAHLDHFGLLEYINPSIPVYMSQTANNIIKNVYPLTSGKDISKLNINTIKSSIDLGCFKIIPHKVDHSVAGSLAYEIQYKNKKILYTGDFRFHGRTGYLSHNLSKIKDVDYLIMEGTTLGREDQKEKTEDDVIEELNSAFSSDKLTLITFSAQNLDRFVSVYKACLGTKKILVLDPYTCYLLENFKDLSRNIPQFSWNNIAVYFGPGNITTALAKSGDLYKYKSKKISFETIKQNVSKYIIKDAKAITQKVLNDFKAHDIKYIYSLWEGYLEKSSSKDILKPSLTHIHTSGHAYIKDLQEFVKKLSPQLIIPIHTEYPEKYKELYGENVKLLKDSEEFEIIS